MHIPTNYYTLKVYKILKDPQFRRSWRLCIIAQNVGFFSVYGLGYYNLTYDLFFRSIWTIYITIMMPINGIIYYIVS